MRNVIALSSRKPRHSLVGRNSEKHSRMSRATSCEDPPVAGGIGPTSQRPVFAFVLPARIWSMSGNVRVGLVPARFRPGELYSSVSVGETSAVTPSWRKLTPLVLVWLNSWVPAVVTPWMPAGSTCSHM